MNDRPFWLTPRWIAGHLLALALVLLFVRLGAWQLARHGEVTARNAAIDTRLERPTQPLGDLLTRWNADADPTAPDALAYRPATATGVYDPEREVLLRNRSYRSQPGWYVLTPLRLDDDRAVLVQRGWLPLERDDPPVEAALPPAGEVTVEGVTLPEDDPPIAGFAARFGPRDPAPAATDGRLERAYWADVERIAADVPYALEPILLRLRAQAPPGSGELPVTVPLPERTAGPHLGYALQWFAFALIGVVGYVFLMRREARAAHEAER